MILGEYEGKTVCMPKDTRLNRHIAIFGASGTMKSRAIIRNALFQALKRGESVVITDPKAELYHDTSQMYRNAGLSKLDYTKHPMAQEMTSVSIMDYQPQVSPAACSQTGFGGEEVKEVPRSEEREEKKTMPKKKSLYRSAQPPADF